MLFLLVNNAFYLRNNQVTGYSLFFFSFFFYFNTFLEDNTIVDYSCTRQPISCIHTIYFAYVTLFVSDIGTSRVMLWNLNVFIEKKNRIYGFIWNQRKAPTFDVISLCYFEFQAYFWKKYPKNTNRKNNFSNL